MSSMKGGQAVVAALLRESVETVFGIPGVHTLEIYDALYDRPQIRHILARHEGGAAFMADGYARASGRVGVVLAITGPGVTNASTALGQAYADGVPLLLVHSDVDSRYRGLGNLHELKDQRGMLAAITKWGGRAERVGDIPVLIHIALERAQEGWPGPVHVEIPLDILGTQEEVALPEQEARLRPQVAEEELAQAAALLAQSERPLIYAGWGVTAAAANAELLELAERLGAVVLTDPVGKGTLPEDHPLCLGAAFMDREAVEPLLVRADVGLAIGTRLGAMETRNGELALPKPLIHIDPLAENIGRLYPTEVGIVGEIKAALGALLQRLPRRSRPGPREEVARAKAQAYQRLHERAPQIARILGDLRSALGREGILGLDMTLPAYWAARYLEVYEPRTLLNPYYFMALGYGLPAAIGAKLARPDRPVVALCGDGGFLFTCQELATAALYGLDLTIVLFNNDRYGAIYRHQQRRYEGRTVATELANPDFVAFAESFGIRGVRLCSYEDLGVALRETLSRRELALIEVSAHTLPAPW
ncbi:MAG: thiamine pyrophosphate-binding protein [Chloroflexi bacterium]|nr:thiamine pyrophosphate-binding protein [Chloroflexota bacterium]